MDNILVGVDGSQDSIEALRWAIDEARFRGASVHVLHAYRTEYIYYPAIAPITIDQRDIETAAAQAMERVLAEVDVPVGVEVELELINSANPAAELAARSADFDLVVVGSRGLSAFSSALVGSVSQKVAQHAQCPVVILPPSSDAE
jgi:nucleotide-binding universal stress UspA family protein